MHHQSGLHHETSRRRVKNSKHTNNKGDSVFNYVSSECIRLVKTLHPPSPEPSNKSWDRKLNHQHASRVMFDIVIFSFPSVSNNIKNFLSWRQNLQTAWIKRSNLSTLYSVHEPVIFSHSSSPWILRILRMILKLAQPTENGLEALATRFPL
jgi:hypothetical protein